MTQRSVVRQVCQLTTLRTLPSVVAVISAALSGFFLLTRIIHGLSFRSWGDESEHLLGGKALSSGDRLYVSFVDLHGPFIFFLSKTYGDLFGWSHGNYVRIIPASFILLATLAIATSSSLINVRQRSWAVTVFVGVTASAWIVQGLYLFEYYLISGALLAIFLACYAVPSWTGLAVSQRAAAVSGFCATLAVFTSHAWLPTGVAIFLSTLLQRQMHGNRRSLATTFIISAALTAAACFGWLWLYGSILGYIVFHIVFAHTVYLQTVQPVNPELSISKFLFSLIPSLSQDRIVQSVGDLSLFLSVIIGWRIYQRRALVIGVLGILAADARGNIGFQDGTFLILSVALFSLTLSQALQQAAETRYGSLLATGLCLILVTAAEMEMHRAISSPNNLTRKMIIRDGPVDITARSEAAEFKFIRRVVSPQERILALVYRPREYWFAGRLPMKGFYEYLPDDALYAQHPVFGITRDLCDAMRTDPPPVVIFDNWKVWDRYSPAQYMPCLIKVLDTQYTRSTADRTLFVRRDRVPANWQGLGQ